MRLHIYTISELKDWIYNGEKNGLAFSIISNARALALINNPYATDSTPAIAVAFDDGEKPVGYTAVLVDKFNDELIYFGTTGFIDSSMRGKGVGTKLYSAMMEACNNRWFATDSAPAALTISKKTGLNISYYDRYYLSYECSKSLKSYIRWMWMNKVNKSVLNKINISTSLEILRHIDNKTYDFIKKHSKDNLFPRSQEMFNWILQYPFKSCAPQDLSEYSEYDFTTSLPQYSIYAFNIKKEGNIIGVAILRLNMGDLVLLYSFYDDKYISDVYMSLIKHILKQNIKRFRTFDKKLIEFYNNLGALSMNTKSRIIKVSLSYPRDLSLNSAFALQGGDGDMFC